MEQRPPSLPAGAAENVFADLVARRPMYAFQQSKGWVPVLIPRTHSSEVIKYLEAKVGQRFNPDPEQHTDIYRWGNELGVWNLPTKEGKWALFLFKDHRVATMIKLTYG